MVYDVIGVQRVEYDKKDGSGHVSGVNLFICSNIPSERGVGVAVTREYIHANKWDRSWGLGKYDIEYSRSFNGNAYISAIQKVIEK